MKLSKYMILVALGSLSVHATEEVTDKPVIEGTFKLPGHAHFLPFKICAQSQFNDEFIDQEIRPHLSADERNLPIELSRDNISLKNESASNLPLEGAVIDVTIVPFKLTSFYGA